MKLPAAAHFACHAMDLGFTVRDTLSMKDLDVLEKMYGG